MKSLIQTDIELPQVIYKYCSFDIGVKIINSSRLRMGIPSEMNDDLELTHAGYSIDSLEELRRSLATKRKYDIACSVVRPSDILHKYLKSFSAWEAYINSLDEHTLQVTQKSLLAKPGEYNQNFQKMASQLFCMTCFSRLPDLKHMHEKYGDKKRGVAIGISTHAFPDLVKVKYVEKLAPREYIQDEDNISPDELEKIMSIMYTKSTEKMDWSIEKEWRVIRLQERCVFDDGYYYIDIPRACFTEIYFGHLVKKEEAQAFHFITNWFLPPGRSIKLK